MRIRRREKGEGQFGCLIGLIILGCVVFVAYKMIPVKVKAAELRQVIDDESKSAGTHDDKHIKGAILAKARENQLPVTEDDIRIKRAANEITVEVTYTVPIEFPGYTYQWHLDHVVNNPVF